MCVRINCVKNFLGHKKSPLGGNVSGMKPSPFKYLRPNSLDHALELLHLHGDGAKVLAGGQSLLPILNFRLAAPEYLIDINDIQGLNFISLNDSYLMMGPSVTWADILCSDVVAKAAPILQDAVKLVAHYQIRNRGTWAGSCAHADVAAEFPAMAVLCDAEFTLRSHGATRKILAADFFQGALTTALMPEELIVQINIPTSGEALFWKVDEFALRSGDFALAGVAILITGSEQKPEARIVSFGLGHGPQRMTKLEQLIANEGLSEDRIRRYVSVAEEEVDSHSDIYASADYRRAVFGDLLGSALREFVRR
jgi:aerobic carbon-monoxide dehydrogenase medium subunit